MKNPQPASSAPRARAALIDTLVALAGTPDDSSRIDGLLVAVAQLCAKQVTGVDYASVTARREGAFTTVATSDAIATAVDEAQYADDAGPCLEALVSGAPRTVPDIAATMIWPGFRDAANRLGLRASLSIPLFAGRGTPAAALNLYSRDQTTMARLTAAVWAAYDQSPDADDQPIADPGAAELVEGLTEAFAVRASIQQAIGITIGRRGVSADEAYLVLRLEAATSGLTLADVAGTVVAHR